MKCDWILLLLANALAANAQSIDFELDQAPHNYSQRIPQDKFTKLKADLESGRIALDSSSEKSFVTSLLTALDIPVSSQTLVFSTTSLQLSLISPSNPRALYFNEDLYVGYVPRGRIEIVSLDPELGGIFYIFNIPRDTQPPRVERSERCMNCHAAAETSYVPGLLLKSVIPGQRGGSLMAFRQEETGHSIPFDQRFGGWYVTGADKFTNHMGNLTGRLSPEGLTKISIEPGKLFSPEKYPIPTSDLLPQLVLEHQAGFVNRVVEASYRARTYMHKDQGELTSEHASELDARARSLARYLLFANEAPLPAGGVDGTVEFKKDFLRNRRAAADGSSLKDLDLQTRLFKHRCSYMIYSAVFEGLPAAMKQRVYQALGRALDSQAPDPEYAYLSPAEKNSLRRILRETLPDLPKGW